MKQFIAAGLLSLAASTTFAGTIEYAGYSLDTDTNIVSGSDLEWLQWDVTDGQSINQALNNYSGWRLASNIDMAQLFNSFDFGNTYTDAENDWQLSTKSYPGVPEEQIPFTSFVELFGTTIVYPDFYSGPQNESQAWYGSDTDGDGGYNAAWVREDSFSWLYSDDALNTADHKHSYLGVALVRDRVSSVPEPGTLVLLGLGLVGLTAARRRQSKV